MKIEPKTLQGFMELLPQEQTIFNNIKEKIKESYEKFGFLPIDTPVIESANVLLAKAGGETEKQIYRFKKGDTDLSLRFDLTVPLAKYVTQYYNNLSFPFKRYQIGKVYRGERPQKGRFREFYQCDIDIIGDENLPILADAEIPSIIYSTFQNLGFNNFTICINNRKILNGLFSNLKLTNISTEILRIIDKIDKIGAEAVRKELILLKISPEIANTILDFITINGSTDEKLEKLKSMNIDNNDFNTGLQELIEVVNGIRLFGVPDNNFSVDLKIARGLDYYTGTVYETFFNDYIEIGSICSGGRYENLAEFYTEKKLPGVGVSIGLTRLFDQLKQLNLINDSNQSISKVMVFSLDKNIDECIQVASYLRKNNINTDIYIDNEKKLKAKMKYANKLNIPYVIIIGENERTTKMYSLKNMETGDQQVLSIDDIVKKLQ